MDKLYQVDDGASELTLPQLMEELIAQKIRCWRAKQETIPDSRIAEPLVAMCWGNDGNLRKRPGCLLPDHKGGYIYVPYDEGDPTPELKAGVERLEKALKDKANAGLVRKMDKALERQVNEKCFWEFLGGHGGDGARIDFHGKAITDITEFGAVHMHWRNLNWDCTESAVVLTLSTFSRPNFTPESALRAQLADLATVEHPPDADDPNWLYILCAAADEPKVPAEDRDWAPLRRQPNDVKLVKRLSRETGKWPVIIRPWQLRHYKLCHQISRLQKTQTGYLLMLEEAKAQQRVTEGAGSDVVGEGYFSQGAVSSLEFAWSRGQALLGGDGGDGGGSGAVGDLCGTGGGGDIGSPVGTGGVLAAAPPAGVVA
ncbi:hypothetical protein C8A05DRAFT_15785 [Staphylotrichum tortipilum]|uniref:Uncharacterized protein n=1 Tax=Staphylotrichum tortipilum TaxID=2831512 RepID=A0AAN6RT75_9PEZI|nr:hypothetical protein C8A05DRAFT_15785 [Staphylotrichum longicolle]